jgi:hypothetical protein
MPGPVVGIVTALDCESPSGVTFATRVTLIWPEKEKREFSRQTAEPLPPLIDTPRSHLLERSSEDIGLCDPILNAILAFGMGHIWGSPRFDY